MCTNTHIHIHHCMTVLCTVLCPIFSELHFAVIAASGQALDELANLPHQTYSHLWTTKQYVIAIQILQFYFLYRPGSSIVVKSLSLLTFLNYATCHYSNGPRTANVVPMTHIEDCSCCMYHDDGIALTATVVKTPSLQVTQHVTCTSHN